MRWVGRSGVDHTHLPSAENAHERTEDLSAASSCRVMPGHRINIDVVALQTRLAPGDIAMEQHRPGPRNTSTSNGAEGSAAAPRRQKQPSAGVRTLRRTQPGNGLQSRVVPTLTKSATAARPSGQATPAPSRTMNRRAGRDRPRIVRKILVFLREPPKLGEISGLPRTSGRVKGRCWRRSEVDSP